RYKYIVIRCKSSVPSTRLAHASAVRSTGCDTKCQHVRRRGSMSQTLKEAALLAAVLAATPVLGAGKHHVLKATPETVQWGWLDPNEPPKLKIQSGDTVSIETLMHAKDQIQPGVSMDKIVELRKANPGGGPHSLTGPIYVEGAEPGDVMEIRILKIVPKEVGTNFNLPGKDFPTIGALASEFPEGHVEHFNLHVNTNRPHFAPRTIL